MSKDKKSRNGFTLIELLVAITILAVISTIGYSIYSNSLKVARDARRKQDLREMTVALEQYRNKNGHFPYSQNQCGPNSSDGSGCDDDMNNWPHSSAVSSWHDKLEVPLVPDFMSAIPVDPINVGAGESWGGDPNAYSYDYWSGDSTTLFPGCPQGPGLVYVLTTRLENANDPDGVGNGGVHEYCGREIINLRGSNFPNETYVLVGF